MRNLFIVLIFALLTSVGCDAGPKSGRGFTLPDGDIVAGKETFLRLQCNACHKIGGIDQIAQDGEPETSVALGGEVSRIQSYGELVTSIINPSHRFARGYEPEQVAAGEGQSKESKMTNYNDQMTVTELIDLVAFLQSKYSLRPTPPTTYPPYY